MSLRPKRRVLVIMKSESYKAEDFIAAARRLGIELIVGSDHADVLAGFRGNHTLQLDFNALEGSVREIAAFHLERPLEAVVAVEDEGAVLAARAARMLGFAANPEESVVAARNKAMMREVLAAGGMESPWFRRYPLKSDPAAAAREAPYPCVLKPLFLAASRGVIRADNEEEFVAAFHRIAAILDDAQLQALGGEDAGALLVEAFIPGAEVALEGMLKDGALQLLALFDKPDPLDGPHFEETIYVTPSRLPREIQTRALALATEGVRCLGLRNGPVHVEMRVHGGAVRLLEVAPRSIGGHCSRVLNFGAGMSLEELILRQALGMAPDAAERERNAAGVMMIPIPNGGRLQAVAGLEQAKGVDGIVGVEITIPISQQVVPLPEGNRYLGFIFAKGEAPETVEDALRRAHRELKFTIR